jgi:uncharacterized protein involved in outer membrane biogenesis
MKWTSAILVLVVAAIAVGLSLLNWNAFRPAVARRITMATGRPTAISGDLKVDLWSWNPTLHLHDISIKNPPWAKHETMLELKELVASISLLRLLRGQVVLPRLELRGLAVDLERVADGRASWALGTQEGRPKDNSAPPKLPTVQRLIIEDGKLHVADEIRKLTFSGSLSAADGANPLDRSALKIRCSGTLNAKPFRLEANGGPLLDLEPHKPYAFKTHIAASDIELDTDVTVPRPFDLRQLAIRFSITGNDLADAYYLTGLALPNTPPYRLAGTVTVDGADISAQDLKGRLGHSDISGNARIQAAGKVPKLNARLTSQILNIVDVAPTLGSSTPNNATSLAAPASTAPTAVPRRRGLRNGDFPSNQGRLLPDADLQVDRVRGMDADVTYQAAAVTAPKVPMKAVQFHLLLKDGVLTLDPLTFTLEQGRFRGTVQIDARNAVPVSDIDMRMDDVHLDQFKSAKMRTAPMEGSLFGRIKVQGSGSSIHKLASASSGLMTIVIPHGEVNDAIAELTGIDALRGVGLLLSKGDAHTDIRCGVIDFKDHQGVLDTTTVFVDTTNVLITGRGNVNLGDEAINLRLQGDPKKLRLLRIHSPITVSGTLSRPAIGIRVDKLAEQTGIAVALSTLLTPVAAAIAFIDPGLAKDKDCATVIAQADAGVSN